MQISERGLSLIKQFEGCKLQSYLCPANVWTIGYGHTGTDVTPNMAISRERADELLRADLARFERAVSRLVTVVITQQEFDALVAFVFNVGIGAFERSTLLALLNKGDIAGAAAQFGRWNKAAGQVLPGLSRRRAAERALFESDE